MSSTSSRADASLSESAGLLQQAGTLAQLLPGGGHLIGGRGKQPQGRSQRLFNLFGVRELLLLRFQLFQFAGLQGSLVQAFPSALVIVLLVAGRRKLLPQFGKMAAGFQHLRPGGGALPAERSAPRPQIQRFHAETLVLQLKRLVLRVDVHQAGGQLLQHAHAHRLVAGETA